MSGCFVPVVVFLPGEGHSLQGVMGLQPVLLLQGQTLELRGLRVHGLQLVSGGERGGQGGREVSVGGGEYLLPEDITVMQRVGHQRVGQSACRVRDPCEVGPRRERIHQRVNAGRGCMDGVLLVQV